MFDTITILRYAAAFLTGVFVGMLLMRLMDYIVEAIIEMLTILGLKGK